MRHPIFIPSKGRGEKCITANLLIKNNIPFTLVIEPQDEATYRNSYPEAAFLILPRNNCGIAFSRSFIKNNAKDLGFKYHWQIDDDISKIMQVSNRKIISEDVNHCLSECELFMDAYQNIGAIGLCNAAFGMLKKKPFQRNQMVYCVQLIRNDIKANFRIQPEDSDFSLQILASGMCTILVNKFLFAAPSTNSGQVGGLTQSAYRNDGRAQVVRNFLKTWPHTGKMVRRNGLPRLQMGHVWRKYKTQLIPYE
jgi:hypothetical protein